MKNTAIIYGSATGTTAGVAKKIGEKMNIAEKDIYNVAGLSPDIFGKYDTFLLGTSTWGHGDVEDDWYDFLDGTQALELKGKRIALFGCGDETMADTFCDGVGYIYNKLKDTGATFVGSYPADVYKYTHTDAEVDGRIVGLLLDETNHPDLTDGRIDGWLLTLAE